MKLNVKAFAVTCALLWGFGLFFLTWWIIAFDGATGEITLIGRLYRGYNISPLGSFIGLLWGLVDGFLGGVIFAWLYNRFSSCGSCCKEKIRKRITPRPIPGTGHIWRRRQMVKKCQKCKVPLEGFLYKVIASTLFGVRPSAKEPGVCNKCEDKQK